MSPRLLCAIQSQQACGPGPASVTSVSQSARFSPGLPCGHRCHGPWPAHPLCTQYWAPSFPAPGPPLGALGSLPAFGARCEPASGSVARVCQRASRSASGCLISAPGGVWQPAAGRPPQLLEPSERNVAALPRRGPPGAARLKAGISWSGDCRRACRGHGSPPGWARRRGGGGRCRCRCLRHSPVRWMQLADLGESAPACCFTPFSLELARLSA